MLVCLIPLVHALQVNFRELVFPSTALPSDNLQYNSADLISMANQGERDAINSIHNLKAQVSGSCPHPSSDHEIPCTQDRDCYSWAVSHCANANAAETSRCNMHVDSMDSFGACEFHKHYVGTCCIDHPWMKRKVSRRPPVTTKKRPDLSSKCYAAAVSGGGDRCVNKFELFFLCISCETQVDRLSARHLNNSGLCD